MEEVCAAWTLPGDFSKNASAMVVGASPSDRGRNHAFRECTNARQLFANTARVRHSKDKPCVEAATWWKSADMQKLGAGTARRVPRDVYESEEGPHMQPASEGDFDVPHRCSPKVHHDHHVQVVSRAARRSRSRNSFSMPSCQPAFNSLTRPGTLPPALPSSDSRRSVLMSRANFLTMTCA